MSTETPIQRVEYLLARAKEEEARASAAGRLRDRLYRSDPAVTKVTAEPTRNGWRFWAHTRLHSPYAFPVEQTEFVLTGDEIAVFEKFLGDYVERRTSAKESYEAQVLNPKDSDR